MTLWHEMSVFVKRFKHSNAKEPPCGAAAYFAWYVAVRH